MYYYNNKSNKKQVKETVTTWSQNWLVPATQLINNEGSALDVAPGFAKGWTEAWSIPPPVLFWKKK